MAKLTINDLEVSGKRVFVRVDFNVPMEESGGRMVINDATRIEATLPTLKRLLEKKARIVLASHLGRPKGQREPTMSLKPVSEKLSELLGVPVAFADDCVGDAVKAAADDLSDGQVLLLENLRYHAAEEANDAAFAGQLAELADVYVNDAFGAAHRAHASTAGLPQAVRQGGGACAAGLLMERELRFLGDELESPEKPFVVILGGAKVSDKIKVIDRLLEKADTILIGGAMAYTFKLCMGHKIGKSLVEADKVDVAQAALDKAQRTGVQFLIPTDVHVAEPVDTGKVNAIGKAVIDLKDRGICRDQDIPDHLEGVGIGSETVERYSQIIREAKTILWNGPMGLFEMPEFADETFAIARAVAEATQQNGAKSIIGGGDSVKALNRSGLGDHVTFMSTGGGASLEFLEGKELPGVAALDNA